VLERCRRLYPHLHDSNGFFAAKPRKQQSFTALPARLRFLKYTNNRFNTNLPSIGFCIEFILGGK
jgi:hypothetical protein